MFLVAYHTRFLRSIVAAASFTGIVEGQALPKPNFITPPVVVSALQRMGLSVSASQLELPLQLRSRTEAPYLRATSAEVIPDGRLRLRMTCQEVADCLPFLVLVRVPASTALQTVSSFHSDLPAAVSLLTYAGPLIRAGEHTLLIMEDQRMRIVFPAVSIDSGAMGAEIRVSSLDRKQVFKGVVIDSSTVRASLP